MRAKKSPITKAICLSVALMGATGVAIVLAAPDVAIAKNDKAKDKSSKAKGKSDKAKGKSDKAKGKSGTAKSKAKKTTNKSTRATESDEAEQSTASGKKPCRGGNKIAVALGVHPSELGNLNAWNSNDAADTSSGMPGRLAAFEDYVVWSEAMGMATTDVDAAQLLFGDPTCDAVATTDCSYDLAALFPDGIPADTDAAYQDYLVAVAANDALDFVEMSGGEYDAFGPEAELAAIQDIANKPIDDDLFGAIRDWVLANAEDATTVADGEDETSAAGEG